MFISKAERGFDEIVEKYAAPSPFSARFHTLVDSHICQQINVRCLIQVGELIYLHAGGFIPSLKYYLGRQNELCVWPVQN